ncbi:MAG: HigA family addiction module antidote protein [Nitrospinae bacterium]|nr:HigA family addiction module antidote protein [Nitrospinota bacterium]
MKMHNPPHPGKVIKEFCLGAELTISGLAQALGVSRKTLSAIINGRAGISPEMALRLSKAFDDSPEMWLGMQMDYDLWNLRKNAGKLKVKKIAA